MKLTALKPRIGTATVSRLKSAPAYGQQTERKRGSAGVRDRISIKVRDCGLCQECNRRGITMLGRVVDHIVALWAGGSDEDDNKQLLCDPCHDEKSAREATQRALR